MTDRPISRRTLLTGAVGGLVAIPVIGAVAPAHASGADLPRLDPASPQAKALGYVHDASKVDAKANPMFKPGQLCSNCVHWTGGPNDPWAGCNLFPGRSVANKGWCKVWAKKP